MFFNGGIIITFNSFPSEYRTSQVFTHFDFKMTLSFAITGSIAATTMFETMPERKNYGVLSLNVKKLLILYLVWKANWILQNGSLFFIMKLILVRIWRDDLSKYGRAITKLFLGTVLTTSLGASILSNNSLMHLSTKSHG